MSGQILELLIFAGIAIFVIGKLISIIGSTTDEDPAKNNSRKSFFGEPGAIMKEIRTVVSMPQKEEGLFTNKLTKRTDLEGLIVAEHEQAITNGLLELQSKMPSFNIQKFLKGSKVALRMLIDYNNTGSESEELIDKRYIEHFKEIAQSYGNFVANVEDVKAQISEIYTFGNNVFVKVLFTGQNITDKIKNFHEEWTFSKSAMNEGPAWYLSNIDRPQ